MDFWKGSVLPLRKSVTAVGFSDSAFNIEHDIDSEEFWEQYKEEYAYLGPAVQRAQELKYDPRPPEEIWGVLYVNIKGSTMYYWKNYQDYLDFEASGFDIMYYNENIRVRPFPSPFPPAKN